MKQKMVEINYGNMGAGSSVNGTLWNLEFLNGHVDVECEMYAKAKNS